MKVVKYVAGAILGIKGISMFLPAIWGIANYIFTFGLGSIFGTLFFSINKDRIVAAIVGYILMTIAVKILESMDKNADKENQYN